jgi:PAS domain S-box-containing protein
MEGFITEAKEVTEGEQLNNELIFYKKAIDVNTICSITDKRGKIIFANKKFCEISKYSEAELIGANHRIINSGYHPPEFFENMWRTISSGSVWHDEIKNKAKDGTTYWVDTVILPIINDDGRVYQYLSLRTVITDRKVAEEYSRSQISLMEKMLFMISHEIRRPVSNIMGLINLLDDEAIVTNPNSVELLEGIKFCVSEIDVFTRELSDFIHNNKINLN